ncbi:MAG: aminopeptidase [Elusimicrobiales bacterium]|nr:aminopeptidase [Elusimicrobiales bacterium]
MSKQVFTQKELEKYADTLIWGLKTARPSIKKYDTVLIKCDIAGLELGEIVHAKLIKQRYNVIFRLTSSPVIEKDFFMYSDSKQRKFIAAGEKELSDGLGGYIAIHAPESLTHLKDIDTKRQSEVAIARKCLRDIMNKNEEKGRFGWTLCTYPTEELARNAKLSLKAYSRQIAKACFLNEPNPAKKWAWLYKESTGIKKWLKSLNIDQWLIQSKSTDLKIKIGDKRKFLGVSGHNIPSFEIFTSPDCRYTEGVYFANQPSFRGGNYVEGVKLEFKNGKAVKISAKKGQDYVRKILATDKGASMVGEISLTDKRFSKIDKFMANTLFDENFGGKNGNCHLAVGDSYSDTYSGDVSKMNKKIKEKLGFNSSSIHWDLVNTEDKIVKAVLKNGKTITIYEKGMFKR